MALRGVWIINDGTDGKRLGLLFSRYFAAIVCVHTEKQA